MHLCLCPLVTILWVLLCWLQLGSFLFVSTFPHLAGCFVWWSLPGFSSIHFSFNLGSKKGVRLSGTTYLLAYFLSLSLFLLFASMYHEVIMYISSSSIGFWFPNHVWWFEDFITGSKKDLRTPGLYYQCVTPIVKCLVSEILGGNAPSICINGL